MKLASFCKPALGGLASLALALPLLAAAPAGADVVVGANVPIVVSDDITNQTRSVVSASSSVSGLPSGSGSGSSSALPSGSDDASGKSNKGHGNNLDGVDSGNPGNGQGGPNGADDPSCPSGGPCVDDEAKGGGSSASKGKKK